MKEVFQALHSSEIEDFIGRLGLFEKFKAGEIKCHACGDTITTDNFKALTRKGGRLVFACMKERCFLSLGSFEESK